MRSEFVEKFNHDDDAADYDADVLNESHHIRAGYNALLDWVAQQANSKPGRTILDLGAGTGNLTLRLQSYKRIVCVDVSEQMSRIGQEKLSDLDNIEWFQSDLLEIVDQSVGAFDAIVSTYAIHHLTDAEKEQLFGVIHAALNPNGVAAFGDLMFKNQLDRKRILDRYRNNGQTELAQDIEDEFFWDIEHAAKTLGETGFQNMTKQQFSTLSWGIVCNKL
jgi:putative AdoMet-dependent methyltransferase